MKKVVNYLFILLFIPLVTFAEEPAAAPTQPPTLPGGSEAGAAPSAGRRADVEIYAITSQASDRIFPEDNGVVAGWRERVFKTLLQNPVQLPSGPDGDIRLLSKREQAERSQDGRIILRTVLNETLKFTQERLPELDKLVKTMRLEASASLLSQETVTAGAGPEINRSAPPVRRTARAGLFIKTGLRIPVESGKLSLLSETEATYGALSTFFKVAVDGRYDNSVGVSYAVAKDIHLKLEQSSAHVASQGGTDGTTVLSRVSLVHFVCTF